MNRTTHNIIFAAAFAVSIVLIWLMRQGILMAGYFAIVPYILVFVSVWLLLSINMLKSSMKHLYEFPTDKRAEIFTALLRKSFLVELFIKKEELTGVYRYIIALPQVDSTIKIRLYEAFDRKNIYVPYPAL